MKFTDAVGEAWEQLKDDKSPCNKWASLIGKMRVTKDKVGLLAYLPQLQKFLTEKLATDGELSGVDIVSALVDPVDTLGKVVEKIAQGRWVFLNRNYGAQRTRKTTCDKQSQQNIIHTDSAEAVVPGVEFVKENYKGNLEALKRHRHVESQSNQNEQIDFDAMSAPSNHVLAPLLTPRLSNEFQFLQVKHLNDSHFVLGDANSIETELFPLMQDDDSSLKSVCHDLQTFESQGNDEERVGALCMKYGKCALLVDDAIGQLNLREVRAQVRGKMQVEQNGLSK